MYTQTASVLAARFSAALRLVWVISLALIAVIGLLLFLSRQPVEAAAQILYVATEGDCGSASPCYSTVQTAVDAAQPGDTIKVAQGTYTSTGSDLVTIDAKPLTLSGGYTILNWNEPDPLAHPTILDAQGSGRVVFANGTYSLTLQGLTLTGGDAGDAFGGGLYLNSSGGTLFDCKVIENQAHMGGGIAVDGGYLHMQDSQVVSNTADSAAGGVLYWFSSGIISSSLVAGNNAGDWGGGISFGGEGTTFSLLDSTISHNIAGNNGGGLSLGGRFYLHGNTFTGNQAESGGGLIANLGTGVLENNLFESNHALQGAGGMLFFAGSYTVTANTIQYNTADGGPGGVHLQGQALFTGNTVYSNTAGMSAGGLSVYLAPVVIRQNAFLNNSSGYSAGAFSVTDSPDAQVISNTFAYNSTGWGGGAIEANGGGMLRGNQIYSNTCDWYGGGVSLGPGSTHFVENEIYGNYAGGNGGGLSLGSSEAELERNRVYQNQAVGSGGGIHTQGSSAIIQENWISQNSAGDFAGGVALEFDDSWLISNTIQSNHATYGGGILLYQSDGRHSGNLVVENIATGYGGGLHQNVGGHVRLEDNIFLRNQAPEGGGLMLSGGSTWPGTIFVNTLIAENQAQTGSAIFIRGSEARFLHTTIAANSGASGVAVSGDNPSYNRVWLTNTMLVSHTVGISLTPQSVLTMTATLWGDGVWANGQDWNGAGQLFTGTVNLWGDPVFIDPPDSGYHIRSGSAAIDAGVDAGVYTDIDGEPRPMGAGFDIGADELLYQMQLAQHAAPDPVASGSPLTYTLYLTNTGAGDLHLTITDVLPAQADPGSILTWTVMLAAPGSTWMQQVPVVVDAGYSGLLTNTVHADSLEGPSAESTSSVAAMQSISGLAAASDGPTILGQPTAFTATLAAGDNVIFAWNFGDGGSGSGQFATHTYQIPGVYTATVTASNPVSQSSATTRVEVLMPIFMPSIHFGVINLPEGAPAQSPELELHLTSPPSAGKTSAADRRAR